jgi:1-acyl-sn-glycerol-3-phosphate acyltransferase
MRSTPRIAPILEHIIPPLIKLWIKEIKGLENLPENTSFLIAPNHCSYIEHIMIGSTVVPYLNKRLHIIAKREHFQSITQSTWHSMWEKYITYIPIDREKGKKALKSAQSQLKKDTVVLIYPEGTRSLTGKIQKGKTGVARLVLGAKVPVVPLGIKGTFEILPKGKKIPSMKRAILKFGKPLYFDRYYNKKITKNLLRAITDRIMKEIAQLSGQKYDF